MTDENMGFAHRYVPASADGAGGTTLLMLHGTGGDENDLLPLGASLLPGAALLSPRGNVLEHGMPRFFRRLAEGVFDQQDLTRRTEELAKFVEEASVRYGIDRDRLIAVGFSNGANIAASMLLRGVGGLKSAVLLSPMVPFEPNTLPALTGTRVFIGAGKGDPMVPTTQVERLGQIFRDAGADVTTYFQPGGHTITKDELEAAQRWISN